ncbi:hypothetical protein FR997_15000 [Phocaeicola dorei]|nr:hypothetical protein FR997_15000 [Phocaeicola dorei]
MDYTKVIILILWWRNFQLEYWRTFQLVSTKTVMATMAEKMAASLEELRKLQEKDRCVVLQGTAEIGRTHLTRLLDNGWLQEA